MFATSKFLGKAQSLGFIMVGIEGLMLTDEEKIYLQHPAVAGVVLFSRNYQSPEQLTALTHSIHAIRHPRLLIAVDQEGGRVQRFNHTGFTRFSAPKALGVIFDHRPHDAETLAFDWGWIMASELLSCGVDFSFAPVVDLDYGHSSVIGDRALHHNPHVVGLLANAMAQGMQQAGMSAVAKHFPGHGFAEMDTHLTQAIDPRTLDHIKIADIQPYKAMIQQHLGAIMISHVIYPNIDREPAGMSDMWLQYILRQELGFIGAIISDDLGMSAVSNADTNGANLVDKFKKAGCDLVLICNDTALREQALAGTTNYEANPVQESRLIRLHGNPRLAPRSLKALHQQTTWLTRIKRLQLEGLITLSTTTQSVTQHA